jgi:uncharacterized protein (TIGR03067 family)
MSRRMFVALVALAGLTAFAPAPRPRARPGPVRIDLKQLEGRWVLLWKEVGQDGGPPVRDTDQLEAEISAGRYTPIRRGAMGRGAVTTQIALGSERSPCWFDLMYAGGSCGSKGVCSLEGDTLKICYVIGDGQRPKSLTPSRRVEKLLVFQRKKM